MIVQEGDRSDRSGVRILKRLMRRQNAPDARNKVGTYQ